MFSSKDWFVEYQHWRQRAQRAEALLKAQLGPDVGLALHLHDLEVKNRRLKEEITHMRRAAEDRNRELAAMKLVVYCSGGCAGGVPDPEAITEAVVQEAERNTRRLREWWENRQLRLQHATGQKNSEQTLNEP